MIDDQCPDCRGGEWRRQLMIRVGDKETVLMDLNETMDCPRCGSDEEKKMTDLQFKIPEEFASGPVGTWKIRVPEDGYGGGDYEVGIFTGHVADIAFSLSAHQDLEFEPVEDLVSTKELPEPKYTTVQIKFGIKSKTWDSPDIPGMLHREKMEYPVKMVHEFLSRSPSRYSFRVTNHNHYRTFTLDRRITQDPFILGAASFVDSDEIFPKD